MIVLGIDTSGPTGGVALVSEDGVIAECVVDVRRTYSERLMTTLEFMLRQSDLKLSDLSGIAVSRGPGSYTGLRIGITVGKVLCYCLEIPLVGVSTLRTIAHSVAGLGVTAVPMIDARRDRVFASAVAFGADDATGTELIPEDLVSLRELLEKVASLPGTLCLMGSGATRYSENLKSHLELGRCVVAEATQSLCRPSNVARLGIDRLARGEKEDPFAFEPVYLRPSEAEVRWREKHAGLSSGE